MKKSTKILSLILSVLTLLSVFSAATPVFAEEITEITSGSTENVDDMTVSSEETETEETEEAEIVSEIEDMRTEYTKYFRMSDGSYMAAQYAQPVHFKENGEWKEYDYSITKEESTNDFVIENSDNEMSFPEEFSEDNETQIEVSAREYDIKFSPVFDKKIFNNSEKQKGKVKDHKELKSNKIIEDFTEEAPIDESADKNSEKLKINNQKSAIAYEEVYSNVDLEYEISSNQIKESIVLNSKQDKSKFEFTVDTDGLFPKKETDGSITLYEDKECTKPVSSIMKPFMYDANGEFSYDVTMDIKEKKGTYILTIKADNNWLNDKARKYPVVIDPSITLDVGRTNTTDCYADNSQPNTAFPYDYYIYAGHSSLGKTRAFVKFKLPDIPDKCSVITSASIHYIQKSADVSSSTGYLNIYNVTSDWKNTSLTWNNQPSVDKSLVLDYAEIVFGANVVYSFDITKTVKAWYQGETNYGLMLASANESVVNRAQLYSSQNYAGDAYPQITVTYRNNKGIEDYWSYSSYSNGAAGSAYINDYTGNLVYALPILSSVSDLMPLNLVAYYNTYSANIKFCAGKGGSSKTTPGKGFRLNVQQTLLESSEYDLKGEDKTKYPYVYTDADGTEHYIEKTTENGKTVYKDEDGLGLTLSLTPDMTATYQLTDKAGNRSYFNVNGNLFCQKDANGNQIYIYFKPGTNKYGDKEMINYIIDGAGHKFTFNYYTDSAGISNGYIFSITDNAKRTVNFNTKDGYLKEVTYMDGTKTKIVYESGDASGLINYVQDNDGYALNFNYSDKDDGLQVVQVTEYGRNEKNQNIGSQIVTFDRTKYNKTVVHSAGIDGIHGNVTSANKKDDIISTLQFDNTGKPISQQVSFGSGNEIGAGMCSYTNEAISLGTKNKISSSSSLGKNVINHLSNSNAEKADNWVSGAGADVNASHYVTAADSYMGKKALAIKNNSLSKSGASYYYQDLTDIKSKTYTFSAYVRAGKLTKSYTNKDSGAHLQINAYTGTGTKSYFSEKITSLTDTSINGGWRRLTVTVPVPDGTTKLRMFLCLRDYVGTVYFDCIQLESGSVANTYNMLQNSSFEKQTSHTPTLWSNAGDFAVTTNSNGGIIDGVDAPKAPKEGVNCLLIDGDALKAKGVSQRVEVKSNENDTYIVSGWAYAYAVNDTWHSNTKFEILPRVYYTKTDSSGKQTTVYQDKDAAKFNTTISGWQYSVASFALKYSKPESGCTYTPKYVIIMPRYNYQENYAYFDHIQLIKDAGQTQTYTYDKDGNVVLTAVNSEQKVNTKYNDKNDLTEYTDIAGYKTTATYDDNHNLKTVKSPRGIVTNNSYYENGIVDTTETQNSVGTASIKTAQALDTEHNSAIVSAVFDQHGYETSFNIHPETGVITDITTPNQVVTYQEYNKSFTKLERVTTDGTIVDYSYNGNRISNIIYSGGERSENYGFLYDEYGNTTSTTVNGKPLSTKTYGTNNGPLKSSVYGNNDSVTYNYNNLGLKSSIVKKDLETVKTSTGTTTTTTTTSNYSWAYTSTGVTQSHTDKVNNRKYLYDYDSLGRLIRQEIQTNDASATHIGSTEVTYDMRNNVTKVVNEFDGYPVVDEYLYSENSGNANAVSYARDNLISRYYIANTTSRYVDYFYDSLNRLNKKSLVIGTKTINSDYSYKTAVKHNEGLSEKKYKTTQLGREILDNTAYSYYYDVVGNITDIKLSTRNSVDTITEHRKYTYDSKNQILSETITKKDSNNNKVTTKTEFAYDDIGNISSKKVIAGTNETTIAYNYGKDSNAGWNHILTAVNLDGDLKSDGTPNYETNETIEYDAIGNPITYLGASLAWNGRELTGYKKDTTDIKYTYDVDGLRTSKDNNGEKSTYYYVSGQLRYETRGNLKFYYFYDASGNLSAIRYYDANGTAHAYFALTNAQGDVVSFYNNNGVLVASYEYDAWGNIISVKDGSGTDISTDEDHIANLNPIRYRGYYYDSETGLYYLQSRYYNPQVGRFLNADSQIAGVGGDVLGNNVFAYCFNNPVNMSDPTGHWPNWGKLVNGLSLAATGFFAVAAVIASPCIAPAAAILIGAAGIACMVMGAEEVEESFTGYNTIKDKVFKGNETNYNTFRFCASTVATIGSINYSNPGNPTCFVAGTYILANSGLIEIERIEKGDYVWSKNPETGEKTLKKVVQTFEKESYELVYVLANNEEIITTPEHPFYVHNKGWVESLELRAGDILVLNNGEYVIVEKIQHEILENPIAVYNFEVEDFHTYYVGESSILVHNANCGVPNPKNTSELAKQLGYEKTNYFSHGQRVYYNAKKGTYIARDIDSHNGGFWKMAKSVKDLSSKSTRMGTYDEYLNLIGD